MNKKNKWAPVSLGVVLTLVIGLSASALCAWALSEANDNQARGAVQFAAQEAADAVQSRLRLYEYGLRGARGVVLTAGEQSITRDAFYRYSLTRDLAAEFPGARGFGFIRRVPVAQEAQFLAAARADGKPDFAISQFGPQQDERFVIQYLEPSDQNERAIGLDIASDPSRRNAAKAAMRTGKAQLTAPITLVQADGQQQQSFLILMPVYRDMVVPASVAAREQSAFGWSFAPLMIADVLAGLPGQNKSIHLSLSDISVPGQETSFYDSAEDSTGADDLFTQRVQMELYGRHWQLAFSAHPAFIQGLHLVSPRLVLFIGVLISLLLAMSVRLGSVSHQRRRLVAAQQAWLAAIVEGSSDGIIGKTLGGLVTSWNKGAEQLFGYSSEEAVGQPLVSLIVPVGQEQEEFDILARIARGERISSFETQRRRRDGSLIDVSVTISPIHDEAGRIMGASKTVRDITADKTAEAKILELNSNLEDQVIQRTLQLSELNMLLTSVLNSASNVSIIATDVNGIIQVFNKGAEGLLGYTAGEVVNRHAPSIFHVPEELTARGLALSAEFSQPIEGFRSLVYKPELGEAETREWHFVRKDGSRFPVILVVTAMRNDCGQLSGYLGIAIDITVRRELESSLRQAKEQADAASAAKSSFLANMSHEIRTPMSAVLGMLQLVLQTELSIRQHEYVTKAQTAAKSLLGLLNDILDYSKIEANKLQLDLHPFELEALMRDLAVVLAGNQIREEVEVMFDLDVGLPGTLIGDSFRLQQILINLAGNALKFTAQGQVVVSIKRLEKFPGSVSLRIAITDTGIGISGEQLERIFDGFTQAEASTSRRFGGTGLGLVICQRMVKLMGGELRVHSQLGEGSHFWFDIELDVARDAPHAPAQIDRSAAMRILIADDNATSGEILMRTAVGLGWDADYVTGGMLAVERVRQAREQGQAYNVVLMDWRMPGMDGLSAARIIHRQGINQPPPIVIMITAYGREVLNDAYQMGKAPFVGMLTKPVTPQQLAITVQDAMNGIGMPHPGAYLPAFQRSTRLTGLRLLIVEDNMINREIAESLLSSEGASVWLAEGGIEGVNQVLNGAQVFDVVLMDMQMPDIDGLEATRRIRADARFATLPIVAMTANASRADRDLCLAAGMNEHVGKPIDLEQLVTTLLFQTGKQIKPAQRATQEGGDRVIESRVSMIRRMGGNLDLIRKGLNQLGPDLHTQLALLREQLDLQDKRGARLVLHAIKGSAGTMGATALSLRAGQLESQLLEEGRLLSDVLSVSDLDELNQLVALSLEQLILEYGAA